MIVAQWSLVEGAMAEHYGLGLRDMWDMSWRRFRTLYEHLFVAGHLTRRAPDDPDTYTGPQGDPRPVNFQQQDQQKFDPIDDWNRLTGRPAPDKKRIISFDQFASNFGVKRKVIGNGE